MNKIFFLFLFLTSVLLSEDKLPTSSEPIEGEDYIYIRKYGDLDELNPL